VVLVVKNLETNVSGFDCFKKLRTDLIDISSNFQVLVRIFRPLLIDSTNSLTPIKSTPRSS